MISSTSKKGVVIFSKSLFKITNTHERYNVDSKVEYKPYITLTVLEQLFNYNLGCNIYENNKELSAKNEDMHKNLAY